MPDDLPPTTNPKLTAATLESDQATGVSPPGAGGWTPSPRTVFLLSGAPAALGALAISIPASTFGTPLQLAGIIVGTICAAGALYASTLIGSRSAGPRKVQ